MQFPAAMFIEAGADRMKQMSGSDLNQELLELEAFGDERARDLRASGLSKDLRIGYALGLETARVILATNPALRRAGIDPSQIL